MERRVGDGSNGNGMQPDVRKGPWTVEEDSVLVNYVAANGGGAWNNLARAAGLNRTGKSCRMRWLNYLRPDVRRGNISPEEEVLIVELHSRWGNRWSKIAKHLPGRTDNEIKNFWRTKIKKKGKSGGSATGHRSKMAVAEDRASTSTSQTTSLQDHSTNVAPPSSELQDHQNCQVHGDTNTIPPEFLAESADNCWGIEGFWTLMQSLI